MSSTYVYRTDPVTGQTLPALLTTPATPPAGAPGTATAPTYSRGLSYASTVIFTPAAAAYLANDVMDVAKEFVAIGPASSEVIITSTSLQIATTAIISGETSYTLALFSITPPTAFADNDAFDVVAANRASFLGLLPLGTPVDLGSTLRVDQDGINRQISVPASASLFGLLVTVGAVTATAVTRTVTLHTMAA